MKQILLAIAAAIILAANCVAQDGQLLTTYDIAAGDTWQIPFTLQTAAKIKGEFTSEDNRADTTVAATAAVSAYTGIPNTIQNNIEVLILDEANFSARSGGRSFVSAYNSGRQTSGKFAVDLGAGKYRFVLSNAHSALASKQVRLSLDPETKRIFDGIVKNPHRRIFNLIDQRFVIPAGGISSFPITLPQDSTLIGRFTTSGGNNDIDFFVTDELNYVRFLRGQYFSVYAQTGYVTGDQTRVTFKRLMSSPLFGTAKGIMCLLLYAGSRQR